MVLKTIKNKDMGRSYNLKKSPINKGTAAKPSPMKEPLSALALTLIGSAVTAGIGAGAGAIQGSKNRKKQEKLQKEQEAADATRQGIEGLTTNTSGGGGPRLA